MGDEGRKLIAYVGPMLKDLNTFLSKAVPDTRLTIKKYQDAKFEFLAYCLKVKELDDEEYEFAVSLRNSSLHVIVILATCSSIVQCVMMRKVNFTNTSALDTVYT